LARSKPLQYLVVLFYSRIRAPLKIHVSLLLRTKNISYCIRLNTVHQYFLLISYPMTIPCISSNFEKQIVFRASRLTQVLRFKFFSSIFFVTLNGVRYCLKSQPYL